MLPLHRSVAKSAFDGFEATMASVIKRLFVGKKLEAAFVGAVDQCFVAGLDVRLQVFVEHHYFALFIQTVHLTHGTLRFVVGQIDILHYAEAATLAAGAEARIALRYVFFKVLFEYFDFALIVWASSLIEATDFGVSLMENSDIIFKSLSTSVLAINTLELQLLYFVLDLLIDGAQHEGSLPACRTLMEPSNSTGA